MTVKDPQGSFLCTKLGPEWKIEGKKSLEALPALANKEPSKDSVGCYHMVEIVDVVKDVTRKAGTVAETEKAPEDISKHVDVEEPGGALSSNPAAIDVGDSAMPKWIAIVDKPA